jgi:hypothetical protein
MFKKLGFFLFAMGVSASYAIAGGGDLECYLACDDNLEQCMIKNPMSPGICNKAYMLCNDRCAPDLP